MSKKVIGHLIVIVFSTIIFAASAFAGQKFIWDPPAGSEVTGYRLYYGTSPGSYSEKIEVGNITEYALSNLSIVDKTTYFFSVRAFNSNGESPGSNEVSWTSGDNTPPAPPLGVTVK